LTWSNFAACFRGSVKERDMNVFIIGATGYIGRAVTARVLNAGHRVTALVRSEASASRLPPGDVRVVAGSVEDIQALEKGLETADAAIYLAIQGTQGASDADRAALNAIVNHFRGTPGPLLVTSGLSVYVGTPEPFVDEATRLDTAPPSQTWRVALEQELLATGAHVVILRPPMVYGQGTAGPVLQTALRHAREHREALVAGPGANLVPVVHVEDLAAAYVLALTRAPAGTVLNVAATSVTGRDLGRAISYAAGLQGEIAVRTPADVVAALGPLGGPFIMDLRLSNFQVTHLLGWTPSAPSLLYELLYGTLNSPEEW
jgi:nucleoside-diphosphate-sugar epimerase